MGQVMFVHAHCCYCSFSQRQFAFVLTPAHCMQQCNSHASAAVCKHPAWELARQPGDLSNQSRNPESCQSCLNAPRWGNQANPGKAISTQKLLARSRKKHFKVHDWISANDASLQWSPTPHSLLFWNISPVGLEGACLFRGEGGGLKQEEKWILLMEARYDYAHGDGIYRKRMNNGSISRRAFAFQSWTPGSASKDFDQRDNWKESRHSARR